MNAVREANSLIDWLNEDIKDPKTHQWGWDRVAFFGPRSKVRSGKGEDPKWQERIDAAKPGLKGLITSRKRADFNVAGSNLVPLDFNSSAKRNHEEIGDEEEKKEDEKRAKRRSTAQ